MTKCTESIEIPFQPSVWDNHKTSYTTNEKYFEVTLLREVCEVECKYKYIIAYLEIKFLLELHKDYVLPTSFP